MKSLICCSISLLLNFTNLLSAQHIVEVDNTDCISRDTIQTNQIERNHYPAPLGHGLYREFIGNDKSGKLHMEQENNSAWYEFESQFDADLIFRIIPDTATDDYDFTLYKYSDENFCQDLIQQKVQPLRTNFSRNDLELKGVTGLAFKAEYNFVGQGVRPAFSRPLNVKKGDRFILMVNNIYENGSGHQIIFNYENFEVKEQVVKFDSILDLNMQKESEIENKPLIKSSSIFIEGIVEIDHPDDFKNANVTLTNTITGDVLAKTKSDSISGAYRLYFDMPNKQLSDPLQLEISKEDYFFKDTIIKAYLFLEKIERPKMKLSIKKLKKGAKFVVNNFLFQGNSPKPMDRSIPTFYSLLKIMKLNKRLKIKIEGHTNGCSRGNNFSMNLSNARANTVAQYLIDHKIDPLRISKEGFGCKRMLYGADSSYNHLNRRVEIIIVDL